MLMDRKPDESADLSRILETHREFENLWTLARHDALARVRNLLGPGLRRRLESWDILQEVLLEASRSFLQDGKARRMSPAEFQRWIHRLCENRVRKAGRFHAARKRSIRKERRLTTSVQTLLEGGGRTPPSGIYARKEAADRIHAALL